MTDFLNLLVEAKNGQVAMDINQKFNELVEAVRNTTGKGELMVKFNIEPSRLAMGGVVVEVEMEHSTKMKKPEIKLGKAVFFVGKDGTLSRDNPDQVALFQQQQEDDNVRKQ